MFSLLTHPSVAPDQCASFAISAAASRWDRPGTVHRKYGVPCRIVSVPQNDAASYLPVYDKPQPEQSTSQLCGRKTWKQRRQASTSATICCTSGSKIPLSFIYSCVKIIASRIFSSASPLRPSTARTAGRPGTKTKQSSSDFSIMTVYRLAQIPLVIARLFRVRSRHLHIFQL